LGEAFLSRFSSGVHPYSVCLREPSGNPLLIESWRLVEPKNGKSYAIKFPPFLVQHLVEVAQNYREGIFAGTNDVVEKITGTPALSVPAFIEKYRSAFA
jgi:hypothetical protein